jgi:hemerythrin-like domain-containing protein
MSETQTFDRISREALEEHRQIHFYLDQIDVTLKGLGQGRSVGELLQRLGAQLEGLREQLIEHYRAEQQGLFPAIAELLPDCAVEIERLKGEHAKMIEILEMARIHLQQSGRSDARVLRDDIEGFLELFRRHESAEERLLGRAIEKEAKATD